MIPKIEYFFILILFLSSCNINKSDFSNNEKKIYGTPLNIGCVIGRPSEIVCIDSLLLFYDRYDKKTITVFDSKNEHFVRRFLPEGKGPGEVIVPLKLFVSVKDKKIFVFELQKGYLNEYNIEDVLKTEYETTNFQKYIFKDRPADIVKMKNGFVGIGLFDSSRYRLYSTKGEFIDAIGKYPFHGEEMGQIDRFFIYQGSLCSSPEGNCFSMGSSYCDNLEFFRVENNRGSLIKKYETYDVKAQFKQRLKLHDDCVMNYKAAYGTDKYCYMLYSGKTYLENKKRTYGSRKIIVFDWKGNYVKSFEADKDIFSFCVEEVNGTIYAVTHDEEGFKITRYNI